MPSCSHPAPRPTSHALLSTRQSAAAFNQPVNFDTSRVTNMIAMFQVRSLRVPCAPTALQSRVLRACAPRLRPPLPHLLAPTPSDPHISRRASYAPLLTRQLATAFNQPVSFDTSSVTDMGVMFFVRSPRVPYPKPSGRVLRVRAACARRCPAPQLPRLPARTPRPAHRICPSFDSAARVGVQPAGELRHVQRHGHDRHVLRALASACLAPTVAPQSRVLRVRAACARRCPTP